MARGWWTGAEGLLNELDALQRHMASFLGDGGFPRATQTDDYPPVNIIDSGEDLEVTAEAPGLKLENIDVSIVGDTLTIRGERISEEPAQDAPYYRRERPYGSFARTLQLPQEVDGDKAEARYSEGVLSIRIPKAPEVKPRRVEIR